MKNLAIIGASYLQLPLILKAKEMGYTTHVFAWAANDVGEKEADFFYPISIVEKESILEECRKIGICGICSIASDLAAITVNYVAYHLDLIGNSLECTKRSTNKHLMRTCFKENGDPSPKSVLVEKLEDIDLSQISFPLIVKPLDRSGSRGITEVFEASELSDAIERAKAEGFEKKALVEELITGEEFSVECISWKGEHRLLAVTKKYTTGAPNYIETGHMEPAQISASTKELVRKTVYHALDSLGIQYGASHSEIMIDNGRIQIVEIGGRMGGDLIGSDLVKLSTGFDFVEGVINVAVGKEPSVTLKEDDDYAGVRFIFDRNDVQIFEWIRDRYPELIRQHDIDYDNLDKGVSDSSGRHGYYILFSDEKDKIIRCMEMPEEDLDC